MTNIQLIDIAKEARKNAYVPYSHFKVGAALLTKSGKVYSGGNIENASYPAGICAERVAISKAVSDGEMQFEKIAVVGAKEDIDNPKDICTPCGICRQVMAEFCDENFEIILNDGDKLKTYLLKELLPYSFTNNNLN